MRHVRVEVITFAGFSVCTSSSQPNIRSLAKAAETKAKLGMCSTKTGDRFNCAARKLPINEVYVIVIQRAAVGVFA